MNSIFQTMALTVYRRSLEVMRLTTHSRTPVTELQRLYKETLTTYRRYTLWGERETGRCFCPCWQGTAEVYKNTLATYRRYTLW
jgi:hypothetical protein